MGSIIIYQIQATNKQEDTILVQITDRANFDYTGDNSVTYIELLGYAPCFELETFNVNEDKFNPIYSLRATFRFKSTNAVNFSTFSSGEDYRFFSRVTVNSSIVFSGWLNMDDNSQAYLPAGQPVTLTATDNLNALKDIELSDFDGLRPEGKFRLIEIIAWCLRKTEGPYPGEGAAIYDGIKVAFNLFEGNHHSTVDNCPLNQTSVSVKSYQKSANEYEDCYTVLQKILYSLGCRLSQYNNYWYILRIDEYKNSAFIIHNYGLGANYISRTSDVSLDKSINTTDIKIVNSQNNIQRLQRPYKSSSYSVKHKFPAEIPTNVNFIYGDVIDDVLPLKTFNINNWTLGRGWGSNSTTPTCDAEIWRRYNTLDYESERYAILTPPASSGGLVNYIKSEPVQICEDDKFTFSFDYSADSDNNEDGPTSIAISIVVLYGDDNTVWVLGDSIINPGDTPPMWKLSDPELSVNGDTIDWTFSSDSGAEDYTEWRSYSIDAPPAPVTGDLVIHFIAANQQAAVIDDFTMRYNNVTFDYNPLVNGSYRKYDAQMWTMSSEDFYSKKFEEELFLFDGPCKEFKYAMFYEDTGEYFLTANWIDFAMEQYAIPDLLNKYYEFVHWRTYDAWSQNRLPTWILQQDLFGFDVANDYASLIHKYSLSDALAPVSNMNFILLSMRQNWHDCVWTVTLATVNDTTNVRNGSDSAGENFEFKYLE